MIKKKGFTLLEVTIVL
ncbi:prepilin-type N-terminal cleavage/methylation domain-containing protein, partial [Escherichia coli]